tara:strand:- start:842 stop:2737 length:1896 start_codon:yes stop_codon:yes gene_type:complete
MNNFMGPMAPPPAAPGQPQKLEIRTNPNQRANFKQFMRQRTAPMMPMQQQPRPMPQPMPMMQPQMPLRMEMGGSVDIFDPMYSAPMMAPPAPMGFDDGGAVPPRRTEIRGQDHMLSYITPDEADILEALGGSGEAGPMGIPTFIGGGGGAMGGFGGTKSSYDGPDKDKDDDKNQGMSPGKSQAQFGTTEFAGKTEQEAKDTLSGGGGSDQAQAVQSALSAQANAQAAKARQDAANRMQDRLEAGLIDTAGTGQRPEVSMSRKSEAEIEAGNLADLFGADVQTPALTDQDLGISTVDITQPDDTETLGAFDIDLDDIDLDSTEVAAAEQKAKADLASSIAALGMPDEYEGLPEGTTPDYDDPNRPGYKDGLPTGLKFVTTPTGTKITKNLAGLTAAQKKSLPGYMNPTQNTGFFAGLQNFLGEDPMADPLGFEVDETTGQVTGVINEPSLPGMMGAAIDIFTNSFFPDPSTFTSDEQLFTQRPSVYTGFGPGSLQQSGSGKDQSGDTVKQPFDPCPEGFSLVNGVCTPIEQQTEKAAGPTLDVGTPVDPVSTGNVLVPSNRPQLPFNLQMPVGYGVAQTGGIDPSVASNAALYQNMLNQQAMTPLRLQDGGPVSSRLDQAAGNFLKAIQPAA